MENTFHIQWHITNLCNLRCRHCYQEEFSAQKDLPLTELKKILSNILDFLSKQDKKLVVDVTGGEPFLYKDLPLLLKLLNKNSQVKKTEIITNGLPLNSGIIEMLETFPSIELKISAEGVEKQTYEFFRGKGTFERFIKTCSLLEKTAVKKTLMFTLTEKNFSEIERLPDFAVSHGFDSFVIERFIPWGEGRNIRQLVISKTHWIETQKTLLRICGLDEDISALVEYRGFMVSAKNTHFHLYGAPCILAVDGCAVMPDGTVFPCRRFPVSIGNLTHQQFREIWKNSQILKDVRDKSLLKGNCHSCKRTECYGCRALSFALSENYLDEDPLCTLPHI